MPAPKAIKAFMRSRLKSMAEKQVSIAPLVSFRILFGILMMAGTARFMTLGWIDDHYVNPVFHFTYFGFEWVRPLAIEGMYAVHILLIVASLCVTLGLFYRVAAAVVFICFTYTELIDLTYYLNHYYFVSLISFLMILLPAHRSLSLDVIRKPALYCNRVPAWCIGIIKLQLAVVYIYAGVIKINDDWLIEAMPLRIWLPAHDTMPLLGHLFAWEYSPWIFSWAGMLYDTTIVFWLMNNRTRPWAYLSVIIFHGLTGLLFQIGVFPVVMIAATTIFFSAAWHERLQLLLAKIFHKRQLHFLQRSGSYQWLPSVSLKKMMYVFISIHFLFQFIFPWRFLLYPGNMFWTEQGYRFGWRVMLMEKAGTATFYITDSRTKRTGEVFNSDFLNPHQEKQMAMQPDMILQYAHFLGKHYEARGIYNPQVKAHVYVTLNGKPSRLLIDSAVDLMQVKDGWENKEWILR